jgi:hypothetical protein
VEHRDEAGPRLGVVPGDRADRLSRCACVLVEREECVDDLETKITEFEYKIAEVKKRFPYHSVQPYLIQEHEELEEQLQELLKQRNS